MARVINRSDAAAFGELNLNDPQSNHIYYFYRTPSTWPGDMAVFSTFYRNDGFTTSIVFGCNEDTTEAIAARIENSEDASVHPLLIIGILAEVERERHLVMVKDRVILLLHRVYAMSNADHISGFSKPGADKYSMDSWMKVNQLRSSLGNWKAQLQQMIAHIDELEQDIMGRECHAMKFKSEVEDTKCYPRWDWRPPCILSGRRIKKRLLEIIREYEEKIQECTMVINGVSLATQLAWNHIGLQNAQANLGIATDTRQDSGQMRSIAFLTMIFLPATFVASLFSMGLFNWSAEDGQEVVSPYVWIYIVVTLSLTIIVILLWYVFMRKRRRDVQEKSAA